MNYFAIPGFKNLTVGNTPTGSITDIAHLVELKTGISIDEMKSKLRFRDINEARQIAIYLSRKYTNSTLKQISVFFGGRDHTTALHSINHVKDLMFSDEHFFDKLLDIENNPLIHKLLHK